MPLEPTKHVNGRMWPPGVSGNPNGRPVGSRTAFSHGSLKDLAEVWQEHGAIPCCTRLRPNRPRFEAPNECAIYLLRSSLRQTSCWVSAITGGTGPKITGPRNFRGGKTGAPIFMGLRNRGAPTFCREVERGLFLFPWRPEERDSSLGGRYFNAKRTHEHSSRFLEKFVDPRSRLEPPTVASNEAVGRKRALIKGPKEFRDIREDCPNRKGATTSAGRPMGVDVSPRDQGATSFMLDSSWSFVPSRVRQYRQLEVPTKYGNSCRSGMAN